MATVIPKIDVGDNYKEKYGFFDKESYVFKAKRGLSADVVKEISWMKSEPEWMTKFRLRALQIWEKKEMPTWGADLSTIDFQNIYYYLKSTEKQGKTWDDVPVACNLSPEELCNSYVKRIIRLAASLTVVRMRTSSS